VQQFLVPAAMVKHELLLNLNPLTIDQLLAPFVGHDRLTATLVEDHKESCLDYGLRHV
jgi:hypothetical protein